MNDAIIYPVLFNLCNILVFPLGLLGIIYCVATEQFISALPLRSAVGLPTESENLHTISHKETGRVIIRVTIVK